MEQKKDNDIFSLLGVNPESAREKAFTRGLLSTIFQAASLAGPQARPTSGLQALGQVGLAGLEGYESSMDRTLKEILMNQQLSDLGQKRKRETAIQQALQLPTTQEQVNALRALGAYDVLGQMATAEKGVRQSGILRPQGEAAPSPFATYLQSPSPQVRSLAQTFEQGFQTGRIDEDTADKRIQDLARLEDQFISRQEGRQERALTREVEAGRAEEKKKEGTEEQKLASGFATRMVTSNEIIKQLEGAGGVPTVMTSVAGAVPFVGNFAQRKVMTEAQQKYKQAADNWIRANLRKESGAVIGADEMAAEYATYFPQPGDDAGTIAQKAEAREITTQAMIKNAGPVFEMPKLPKVPKPESQERQGRFPGLSQDDMSLIQRNLRSK